MRLRSIPSPAQNNDAEDQKHPAPADILEQSSPPKEAANCRTETQRSSPRRVPAPMTSTPQAHSRPHTPHLPTTWQGRSLRPVPAPQWPETGCPPAQTSRERTPSSTSEITNRPIG
ncbi:MAG: hypothetical protein MZV64_19245 [Ignavibacteriales bacterium]|nr:hypothetical protein [Ignavibacteriales bacterium]